MKDLDVIIEIFETNVDLSELQMINRILSDEGNPKANSIRKTQIIADSIRICLSSKNFDTASSRFNLMNKMFHEISEDKYLDKEELDYIKKKVDETKKTFNTASYLNASTGFVEKSLKMKSTKGKLKRLALAIQILKDGLEDLKSDKSKILPILSELIKEEEQLKEVA